DSSIVNLQKAIELDKSISAAYTELGYAQYRKELNNDALSTLNKGIALDPNLKLAIYYKGLIYIILNDRPNALKMHTQLKPIDTNLADKLLAKINVLK
ncbi:MAG: hypothetical protein RIS73_1859, partial [Bacteroidota bacterium]